MSGKAVSQILLSLVHPWKILEKGNLEVNPVRCIKMDHYFSYIAICSSRDGKLKVNTIYHFYLS